jgi:hypothetical protein
MNYRYVWLTLRQLLDASRQLHHLPQIEPTTSTSVIPPRNIEA